MTLLASFFLPSSSLINTYIHMSLTSTTVLSWKCPASSRTLDEKLRQASTYAWPVTTIRSHDVTTWGGGGERGGVGGEGVGGEGERGGGGERG